MCGIVGYLLRNDDTGPSFDPIVREFASLSPAAETPEAYEQAGREAERLSLLLLGPEAVAPLLRDGKGGEAVEAAADRIAEQRKTAEERAARPCATLTEIEAWNAASVRFRDAEWRLRKDLLETIPRARALCAKHVSHPGNDTGLACRHAYRLRIVLNALDRLEVRGRDSAGLCTAVWFPGQNALQAFLERVDARGSRQAFDERSGRPDLLAGDIVFVPGKAPALVFAHKTAEEIGALGENTARLGEAIAEDAVYWMAVSAPGTRTEVLAHTRWASNGIVNEANAHPVDDRVAGDEPGPRFLAVLNGDIDNFQQLRERFAARGRPLPPAVTTDAKVIPMLVADKYRETGDVGEAFRLAVNDLEGAFAIALISTDEPGAVRLALKGAGQALYTGNASGGLMFASETYGLVETCDRYVRMEGERPRVPGRPETSGQTLCLRQDASFPHDLLPRSFDGEPWPGTPEVFDAGITTRDIHRGDFEHYFHKEISEAPQSLEKTLRGKFFLQGEAGEETPAFTFGPETVPPEVLSRLREGTIRTVHFIGQGTASVAGLGIARLWEHLLGRAGIATGSLKASELSGFGLERDMRDTLVVAVSQSGTTTDTNRTVEMVKGRGAAVLAIVNRRHADLVHRADGVVYTGDGRDVEMAVASTKAFYAQVAAGYLLGLYLARELKSLPEEEIASRLLSLRRLPDLMREVLRRGETIRACAEAHAVLRRHWAVVGAGMDQVAAEEIRIKLSELNYKSISCDVLEDKKHIDLSAEPLILVCVVSQAPQNLPDAVKEVSIFKAHRAVPVVLVPDGETRFSPYASAEIRVPVGAPDLAFLLETMAGHLWGYFAARAIDEGARLLKKARAVMVEALPALRGRRASALGGAVSLIRRRIAPLANEFLRRARKGLYNSGLEVETVANLQTLFAHLQGNLSLQEFHQEFGERGTWDALVTRFLAHASRAVGELTRPIDAIKHQAKTVTVGISREETALTGPVFAALREASFPVDTLDDFRRYVLESVSRAVREITGSTLYRIEGLDETGMPASATTIQAVTRKGVAASIPSRAESPRPLFGTKRRAVARGRVVLGSGRSDGRNVIIVPGLPEKGQAPLALLHVAYRDNLALKDKLRVLRGYYERYEELRWAVSEIDPAFSDELLDAFSLTSLLEGNLDTLARRILQSRTREEGGDQP